MVPPAGSFPLHTPSMISPQPTFWDEREYIVLNPQGTLKKDGRCYLRLGPGGVVYKSFTPNHAVQWGVTP